MATIEYWLQLENHAWDVCPWGIDRTGEVPLKPVPGGMVRPLPREALIFRRYTPNWQQPADQPLNPWDLTEPDPQQTHGTLPGAVLIAKVGDELVVHFRNMDMRATLSAAERIHSLHPHGVQREARFEGVYPLSPPDPGQNGRRGDRVAPGESFTYHWTVPQRAAAGIWLYQDGGQNADKSQRVGAQGILLIRAPGEQPPDLPPKPPRQAGDSSVHFGALPPPPRMADYLLVCHDLEGAGMCLNGRQYLGNTPVLLAGEGTRMTLRLLNALPRPITFYLHGHRWAHGQGWVDAQALGTGEGVSLSLLEASAQDGGGMGEWLIVAHAGGSSMAASLVVAGGGALTLLSA